METFFRFIGGILEFMDYAIPRFAIFLYRLFVLILLYTIMKQLNEIFVILTSK